MKQNVPNSARAFTLIELMVVIAIIALLVGILLPAIQAAKNGAKTVATKASFQAIATGLEGFKSDSSLGGNYPPSASDSGSPFSVVTDPTPGSSGRILAGGANLLVFALQGADTLGTTGFIDLPASSPSSGANNGLWWDDVEDAYLVVDGLPTVTRYQNFGGEDLKEKTSTINSMLLDGTVVQTGGSTVDDAADLPFYTGAFSRPILYYRARRAAQVMVTNPGVNVGVFDQRDNQAFTGSLGFGSSSGGTVAVGLDFGAGAAHTIALSLYPSANPLAHDVSTSTYDDSFDRFIWDSSVTASNVPVNKDTYLLISAGPDALYGTGDDITNWSRD